MDRRDRILYALSALTFLFTILVYTYPSVQAVQLTYDQQKIKAKERKLIAVNNRLRLEFEMIISPDEMEERSHRAGFVEPAEDQIIYVKKNK